MGEPLRLGRSHALPLLIAMLLKEAMTAHIQPLGDSALLVRVAEGLGDHPAETLEKVLAVCWRIEQARLPGVVEVAPAYTSVAVYLDLAELAQESVEGDLTALVHERLATVLAEEETAVAEHGRAARRVVEIPVCYGGEGGPDLEEVARRAGLPPEEVVARHSGATYLVHCLGFTPGFPYLSGLPPELATPRREVPRKLVPAGSVGIGGAQTGVYPLASPGGWHLLGRTPWQLVDASQTPPTLLQPGDRVRFRAISPEEYERWGEA
jgi:inhibitor of KinA